ncbi:hypothetical protein [Hyalangium minutum]|uniref:Uncharacterized protein n=1 Tax=Hyalangium minutum TaxID=394096 RepID=A0A085WPN4_9BACT|nr:hypothetical protein [Hyalangium minutum]KFE69647.1 hypothetical protein DB31_6622 [Hyalangium minutum]
MPSLFAFLLGLATLLLPSPGPAAARRKDEKSKSVPRVATSPDMGRYLLLGVNAGVAGRPGTNGALLSDEKWAAVGFEASAVRLPGANYWWFGGYMDFIQVLPNRASRLSIGPELGFGFLGVDVGLLGEYSGLTGKFNGGLQGRIMLTTGVAAVYLGAPCLYDSEVRALRAQVQAGMVFKVPIFMGE